MIWKFILYFLKFFDPEFTHSLSIFFIKLGIFPKIKLPCIRVNIDNLTFKNPIGLAAGFDKNGKIIKEVSQMGFGFMEIGTVTPKYQFGNPKPRIFRLINDKAVINRNGFNNDGLQMLKERLRLYDNSVKLNQTFRLGINIGANKDSINRIKDYKILASELCSYADFISINVSSPNTPGLRNLQGEKPLMSVIKSVKDGMIKQNILKPIFIKISPDINNETLKNIITVCSNSKITGLIISNTTISRKFQLSDKNKTEVGGLSGRPLFKKSTEILIKANKISKMNNMKLFFIAVGGIEDSISAYIKILSGAHLCQLYTSLVYLGPNIVKEIIIGLENFIKRDKINDLKEVRGIASSFEEAKKIAINGLK